MDFSGFFTDLFTQLNNDHSWLVILFLIGAFLIGFITALLYWRRKWKSVSNKLQLKSSEYDALLSKYNTQTSTLELKEADLKKARLEIDELKARIRQLEEQKGQLHGDLMAARADFDKVSTEKTALLSKEKEYLTKIEDFDAMVLGLKTKNQSLTEKAGQDANTFQELASLKAKYEVLEKENGDLKIKVKDGIALATNYDAAKDKVTALEGELATLKTQFDSLKQEKLALGTTQSDNAKLAEELERISKENTDLQDRLQDIIALNKTYSDYDELKLQLATAQEEKLALGNAQSNHADLEIELEELKKNNASLQDRLQDSMALNEAYSDYDTLKLELTNAQEKNKSLQEEKLALGASHSDNTKLEDELDELKKKNTDLQDRLQDVTALNNVYSDYDELKIKLAALGDENEDLKRQLEERQAALSAIPAAEVSKEEKTALAKESVKAALGSKIAAASADHKDDLKLINGVGPFIEQKLNGLGIYTYKQVSQFDDELSNQVTDAIEFFPGRIQRDNWVGQAKELMGQKNTGALTASATHPLAKKYKANDLKVVEGIGPKIEGLLNNGGILTWEQLAATPTNRLQEILDEAGDSYRIHNPSTWAYQADLAANGKWEELEKLQDDLDGGVGAIKSIKMAASNLITDPSVMDSDHPLAKKYKLDDLKVVEGIGPKIEGLLNDGDIHTWAALANTPLERLQEILTAAGDRYRMHNPSTWAQQAGLAATGKWEELDKLQDELDGGKVV